MVRYGVALAILAASAGAHGQPAPRVTLNVAVSPAPSFKPDSGAVPGRLAVGADGTYYVLLNEHSETSGARIELVAIGAGGAEKTRTILPVRLPVGAGGFAVQSMGVAVSRSGDLAVFISGSGQTTLFRLRADGRLMKATDISAPTAAAARRDPDAYYQLRHYVMTPDNALLLAGGFGSGPYLWWLGKFSLDGVRIWQGGPGVGFPDSVNAIGVRPDGNWTVILQEHRGENRTLECFLDRYSDGGKRLAHIRFAGAGCYTAAVLAEGSVVVSPNILSGSELTFFDDNGKVSGSTAWPFDDIDRVIADGAGFAAIVTEGSAALGVKSVVRAGPLGAPYWKSLQSDFTDVVRTPDGQIAALYWEATPPSVQLIVYADP